MRRLTLILTLLVLGIVPAAASAAAPDPLTQFCDSGSDAGECGIVRGIAADPVSGDLYIADQSNARIDRFSPWGVFREAWGWGVRDGSAELQTCGPEATPPSGCQQGISGGAAGQVDTPQGITVDSNGAVYLAEASAGWNCPLPGEGCPGKKFLGNNRVQKFGPDGEFILAFGREVNLSEVEARKAQEANAEPVTVTAQEENLCTAVSGDTCGPGVRGSGAGEFGVGSPDEVVLPSGDYIDVAPDGAVYVGGYERIQEFNPDGTFAGVVPDPEEALADRSVQSLTVDPTNGNLYVSLQISEQLGSRKGVLRLSPAGAVLGTVDVENPRALAVDEEGQLYAFDRFLTVGGRPSRVQIFSAAGALLTTFAEGEIERSQAIAVSSACGLSSPDVFVAHIVTSGRYVNAYGPAPDPTICPPPPVPPSISAQYATAVSNDAAILRAEINPHFWPDTTYYVEYGTGKCSEGGCDKQQPLPPGSKLTAAAVDRAITTNGVFLQDLAADTTYHFRFVATSSGGGPVRGVGGDVGMDGAEGSFHTFLPSPPLQTNCPNQAFRTGASAKLPDCRAYEMVSPIDKNGVDIGTAKFPGHVLSAADGRRLTYTALRAFADPVSAPLLNQFLSSRGQEAWSTQSINPPRRLPGLYAPGGAPTFKAFSEDLCQAWVVQDSDLALVPGAPPGVPNLYRRENCSTEPSYELLSPVPPPGGFEKEAESNYYVDLEGYSADGTHAVYRADANLTANACKTERIFQVYITSPNGPLRLVSSLPGNKANCTHSSAGLATTPSTDINRSRVHHAVSLDGETVYWSAGSKGEPIFSGGVGDVLNPKLYVRINATQPQSNLSSGKCTEPARGCTLAVSETPGSEFLGASATGDAALYELGSQLFEYDLEADESRLIAGGYRSLVGASEDLSRLYFISTEVLSGEQQNSSGAKAGAGRSNLYLYDRGTDEFTFVATLGDAEADLGGGGGGVIKGTTSQPGAFEPKRHSSRVSPDGLHLAFTSLESLTGYDNKDATSGQPTAQVYVFDAGAGAAGNLTCVSCNPSGARPAGRRVGETTNEALNWAAAAIPGWPNHFRPSRLLAADGSYLFFESYDSLVATDTNGRKDVYEWRRASSRTACEQSGAESYAESAGGCLSLISSGRSSEDSDFLDASVSGEDVFFTTNAGLLPQDPGLVDVYDARVGGGYPPPVPPPAACEGEACQGPLALPEDPTPASSTFQGAGNVREGGRKPCPKGKVRRKGRCVKKHKSAKKRGKEANQNRRNAR